MTPVIWLNPNNLVLMAEIQWPLRIRLDREMKRSNSSFECIEKSLPVIVNPIVRRNEVGTTEAELRGAASWDKHRAVVDGDRYYLFLSGAPEWGGR